MKKAIVRIACLLLCVSGAAHAERTRAHFLRGHNLSFGLDTEIGVPLGNYADASSVGGGGALTAELTMLDTLSATLRAGVELHSNRDVGTGSSHVHALPILLGTKYYLGSARAGLFGTFEAGTFILMSSLTPARGAAISSTVRSRRRNRVPAGPLGRSREHPYAGRRKLRRCVHDDRRHWLRVRQPLSR